MSIPHCTIRRATPSDLETVVEFNRRLALESEGKQLDVNVLRRGVEKALKRPEYCLYFVAEQNAEPIGQMMITYEWSDWRDGVLWWLQSVYVIEPERRKGVFRALFQHVEELARTMPEVVGLRLYVEEHNRTAQETYLRHGFQPAGYYVLEKLRLKSRP